MQPLSAAIEIGRNFVEEDGTWYIIIPPEETKTNVAIDFEIPGELQDHIRIYLNFVRPRMLRQARSHALWVSPKGGLCPIPPSGR